MLKEHEQAGTGTEVVAQAMAAPVGTSPGSQKPLQPACIASAVWQRACIAVAVIQACFAVAALLEASSCLWSTPGHQVLCLWVMEGT